MEKIQKLLSSGDMELKILGLTLAIEHMEEPGVYNAVKSKILELPKERRSDLYQRAQAKHLKNLKNAKSKNKNEDSKDAEVSRQGDESLRSEIVRITDWLRVYGLLSC